MKLIICVIGNWKQFKGHFWTRCLWVLLSTQFHYHHHYHNLFIY